MAGLFEGGNEPAGSLKATTRWSGNRKSGSEKPREKRRLGKNLKISSQVTSHPATVSVRNAHFCNLRANTRTNCFRFSRIFSLHYQVHHPTQEDFCFLTAGEIVRCVTSQCYVAKVLGIQSVAFISARKGKVTSGHCPRYLVMLVPEPAASTAAATATTTTAAAATTAATTTTTTTATTTIAPTTTAPLLPLLPLLRPLPTTTTTTTTATTTAAATANYCCYCYYYTADDCHYYHCYYSYYYCYYY
ncbi:hypothetical protein ANN_16949 [Periplaneta americana]|uniref:Uncharacterized protein n=1 Tax=Periplaneta americana TaxID=6978 RepID=A0ABQ8SSZ4_PERAM|nr:hypothetical protein ANN_16949 [Periplaneta americana]